MGDSADGAGGRPREDGDLPGVASSLPKDHRNTAPETRSRYRYQDECAALAILRSLRSGYLQGILVEHSTDLALIPTKGRPELVSIKHREASQRGDAGWTWDALAKQRVLKDLYTAWNVADRTCSVAFWSSSGFTGPALSLWKVCAKGASLTSELIKRMSKHLDTSQSDAKQFIESLALLEEPLPRRKEITDIGIRRTENLLARHRPGTRIFSEDCYRDLIDSIASAGSDDPDVDRDPATMPIVTLAAAVAAREQAEEKRRYLSCHKLLQDLLNVQDLCAAQTLPNAGQHGWEPDSHFVGREEYLELLGSLLQPGMPDPVAPVVVQGLAGCGKTSLAAQFAAKNQDSMRPVFINASSRTSLTQALAALAGSENTASWDTGVAELRGPITPKLPGNSATLLILDGVTDAEAIRGIVPRSSLCRVIITTTLSHLDPSFRKVLLEGWPRAESTEFISLMLPDEHPKVCEKLADALFDHPLALTQAASYCLMSGRSAEDYLDRLSREPLTILDQGEANGHLLPVTKSIAINIDAAESRTPASKTLLTMLAYMGNEPFDEKLLGRRYPIVFVFPPVVKSPDRFAWLKFWNPKARQRRVFQGHSSFVWEIHNTLADQNQRDKAVETLILTSLATRRDGGLMVHPLVAMVAQRLDGDAHPWLEIGLGLFAEDMSMDPVAGHPGFALDPYLDHIISLTSTAIDLRLRGVGVFAACHYLTWRLAGIGPSENASNELGPVEFGAYAVRIAEEHISLGLWNADPLVKTRQRLAEALWHFGDTDQAVAELRECIDIASSAGNEEFAISAILDLGLIAATAGEAALVEELLGELSKREEKVHPSEINKASVAHVKTQLLRRVNRIDEAESCNDEALRLAEGAHAFPDGLLGELHGDAALLARDRGDAAAVRHHEFAMLEISQRQGRIRPDRHTINAMTAAADGAVEAGDLDRAASLLSGAEDLARREFGDTSPLRASVLAVRGRLYLHLRDHSSARTDLELAATIIREARDNDRTQLPSILLHLAQVIIHDPGETNRALALLDEAYNLDLERYGPTHPETLKDVEIIRDTHIWLMVTGRLK